MSKSMRKRRTHFSVMREPSGRVGRYVLYDRARPDEIVATVADAGMIVTLEMVNGQIIIETVPKTETELAQERAFAKYIFEVFQAGQANSLLQQLGNTGGCIRQATINPIIPTAHRVRRKPPTIFRPTMMIRRHRTRSRPKLPRQHSRRLSSLSLMSRLLPQSRPFLCRHRPRRKRFIPPLRSRAER